jgi:hypothetical protein
MSKDTKPAQKRIDQFLSGPGGRADDWSLKGDGNGEAPDLVPSTFGQQAVRRPYFETLIVTGHSSSDWPALATEWRKLRRPLDAFVYEPVIVGSLEDVFCAVMLNPNIAAVIINEGFALRSRHNAAVLRPMMTAAGLNDESDAFALRLAHIIKRVRPELDLYLMSNRDVEEMAGNPEANVVRRIFYSIEELLELHLCILEGVQDRYDTPYFDNLKKYAQRPIGTFHALPIARGKSVFRSDWICDMGEFYGLNLFLAEWRKARKAEPGFIPQEDQVRFDREAFHYSSFGRSAITSSRSTRPC